MDSAALESLFGAPDLAAAAVTQTQKDVIEEFSWLKVADIASFVPSQSRSTIKRVTAVARGPSPHIRFRSFKRRRIIAAESTASSVGRLILQENEENPSIARRLVSEEVATTQRVDPHLARRLAALYRSIPDRRRRPLKRLLRRKSSGTSCDVCHAALRHCRASSSVRRPPIGVFESPSLRLLWGKKARAPLQLLRASPSVIGLLTIALRRSLRLRNRALVGFPAPLLLTYLATSEALTTVAAAFDPRALEPNDQQQTEDADTAAAGAASASVAAEDALVEQMGLHGAEGVAREHSDHTAAAVAMLQRGGIFPYRYLFPDTCISASSALAGLTGLSERSLTSAAHAILNSCVRGTLDPHLMVLCEGLAVCRYGPAVVAEATAPQVSLEALQSERVPAVVGALLEPLRNTGILDVAGFALLFGAPTCYIRKALRSASSGERRRRQGVARCVFQPLFLPDAARGLVDAQDALLKALKRQDEYLELLCGATLPDLLQENSSANDPIAVVDPATAATSALATLAPATAGEHSNAPDEALRPHVSELCELHSFVRCNLQR